MCTCVRNAITSSRAQKLDSSDFPSGFDVTFILFLDISNRGCISLTQFLSQWLFFLIYFNFALEDILFCSDFDKISVLRDFDVHLKLWFSSSHADQLKKPTALFSLMISSSLCILQDSLTTFKIVYNPLEHILTSLEVVKLLLEGKYSKFSSDQVPFRSQSCCWKE